MDSGRFKIFGYFSHYIDLASSCYSDMIMMGKVDPGSTRLGFIHKNTMSYLMERLSYDRYWASVLSLYVSDCHLYETESQSHPTLTSLTAP